MRTIRWSLGAVAAALLGWASPGAHAQESAPGPFSGLNRRLDLLAARRARAPIAGSPSESEGRREGALDGDDPLRENKTLTAAGSEAGELDRPNLLGPLLDPINPAKIQKRLDELLGFDSDGQSDKPEVPEIPEPVFFEFIRPLGALKYESELNYLVVAPWGQTPLSHFAEFEYVFADWNAFKVELEFSQGVLETIEPGYQRTLGVGPRGNWTHGFQINPEVFLQTHFVGGSAVYIFGWKPEEESPWSLAAWVGANRTQFDAETSRTPVQVGTGPGAGGLSGLGLARSAARAHANLTGGAPTQAGPSGWRTVANLDFWYTISPSLAIGMENDAFIHPTLGEYLVLPHINWQPTAHLFAQVGVGYYQLGREQQGVFMAHINLVEPTRRKPRPRDER